MSSSRRLVGEAMTIRFLLRGTKGKVRVTYGINEHPERLGYGESVLGADYPAEMARGFPFLEAGVEFDGVGYGADFGWVQVVRYRVHDTGEGATVFDTPPQLSETECPYLAFGVRPTMFDAPGISDAQDVTWDADTFLVHTPDAVLSGTSGRSAASGGATGWSARSRLRPRSPSRTSRTGSGT